jgi:Ca2+-binding EF-hand superfamily protein
MAASRSNLSGTAPTKEEVTAAIHWLSAGEDSLTFNALKKKLKIFMPDLTTGELAIMMGGKTELTQRDIAAFLEGLHLLGPEFSPVQEAFKILDPTNSGIVDPAVLSDIFVELGISDGVTSNDLKALVKEARKQQAGGNGNQEEEGTSSRSISSSNGGMPGIDIELFRAMSIKTVSSNKEGGKGKDGESS